MFVIPKGQKGERMSGDRPCARLAFHASAAVALAALVCASLSDSAEGEPEDC